MELFPPKDKKVKKTTASYTVSDLTNNAFMNVYQEIKAMVA
jgi:hypothetical protein